MKKIKYKNFKELKYFNDLEFGKAFFELKEKKVINFFKRQITNDSFDYPYILIIKYLKSEGLKPEEVLIILRKHSTILLNLYLDETNKLKDKEETRKKVVEPVLLALKEDISIENLQKEVKEEGFLTKLYNGHYDRNLKKEFLETLDDKKLSEDIVSKVLKKSEDFFAMNKYIQEPKKNETNNFDLMIAENYYQEPLDLSLEIDEDNYLKLMENRSDLNLDTKADQQKVIMFLALSLTLKKVKSNMLKVYTLNKDLELKTSPLTFIKYNDNSEVENNFEALKEPFQVKFRNELIEFSKEGVKNITKNVLK